MMKKFVSAGACCVSLWAGSAGLFLLLCHFWGVPLTPELDLHNADQPFSSYLLSTGYGIRTQMHTTWLFLGAFGALVVASILWVLAEKWQQGSKWGRRDIFWMLIFLSLLGGSAILYGLGTNSTLAKKIPRSTTIADVIGVGIVLAVPVILWFRWRRRELKDDQDEDTVASPYHPRTFLGLQAEAVPETPMEAVIKPRKFYTVDTFAVIQPPVSQPKEWLERTLDTQNQPSTKTIRNEAIIMENIDIVDLGAAMPDNYETQSLLAQPFVTRLATAQPLPEPSLTEEKTAPAIPFREQLLALNASWQRIEETRKDVEEWFQQQQRRVLAHMERQPEKAADIEVSRNFLDRKMEIVDAEWATIHQTIREIYQWLENSSSGKEPVQEVKAG